MSSGSGRSYAKSPQVIVLALDPAVVASSRLRNVIGEIQRSLREHHHHRRQ
jgi:hypothetical protein